MSEFCPDCKCEIDPDTCHCGDPIAAHNTYTSGHSPVPMGCQCYRSPALSDTLDIPEFITDPQRKLPL